MEPTQHQRSLSEDNRQRLDCLFCKIARQDLPVELVYHDVACVAFRDISPKAPAHILIIPRDHIENLAQCGPDQASLMGSLLAAAAVIASQLEEAKNGFRVVINSGPNGGQTVGHLHLHLLAGRPLGWPPG